MNLTSTNTGFFSLLLSGQAVAFGGRPGDDVCALECVCAAAVCVETEEKQFVSGSYRITICVLNAVRGMHGTPPKRARSGHHQTCQRYTGRIVETYSSLKMQELT